MKRQSDLELLFQYACKYKFDDFNALFRELEPGASRQELGEIYLMRAQIKLYATDDTTLHDLDKVAMLDGAPKFPRLSNIWQCETPNRFIVFSTTPGVLRGFLQTLPQVRKVLHQYYGEQGDIIVRQLQCEIHYFTGEIPEALVLAEQQRLSGSKNHTDAILTQCLLFRCYLAMGIAEKAEECMLDIIRLSQAHPECLAVYYAIRGWANLTTNWSGDNPRFYNDFSGKRIPVLDDRLEGIRMGSARTTPLEEPFVSYAEHSYENAYVLRQYYMDLFHAMYWFQANDYEQTKLYFTKIYHITLASGVNMPIVECGEHITPLLRYVKDSDWGCSQQWLDNIITRAEQYEKSLEAYQDSDN